MTIDERLDRLTGVVESLAASVVEHDQQIENLIKVAEERDEETPLLRQSGEPGR
jgi:hypothetical protein